MRPVLALKCWLNDSVHECHQTIPRDRHDSAMKDLLPNAVKITSEGYFQMLRHQTTSKNLITAGNLSPR